MSKYVDEKIIEGFEQKGGPFNYKKLISLLKGLNKNYKDKNPYIAAITIRAILDHIPPLLGSPNFETVVNNYLWPSTYKKYMENLLDFKNEGDDSLHTQISDKGDFLDISNLPQSNRLNILLQECLKKGGETELLEQQRIVQTKTNLSSPKIIISLVGCDFSWQNYVCGHYMGYSYKFVLNIDNFSSNKLDYITVLLKANSNDGTWSASQFIFETEKPTPNLAYEVEPNKEKQVTVIVSDEPFSHNSAGHRFRPSIDEDTLMLLVHTKSGKDFELPIKPGWLS